MRAMPSPISSTRPTSSAWSLSRYLPISFWRTETISSALNLITASLNELFADILQPALDRRIELPVANLDDHAGNQVGIDLGIKDGLLVEFGADFLAQVLGLVVRQRHGAFHLHPNAAGPFVVQIAVGGVNRAQHVEPLMRVQHQKKIDEDFAGPALKGLLQHFLLPVAANGAGGEKGFELR